MGLGRVPPRIPSVGKPLGGISTPFLSEEPSGRQPEGEWVTFGLGSPGLGPAGRALVPPPTPAGPNHSLDGPRVSSQSCDLPSEWA